MILFHPPWLFVAVPFVLQSLLVVVLTAIIGTFIFLSFMFVSRWLFPLPDRIYKGYRIKPSSLPTQLSLTNNAFLLFVGIRGSLFCVLQYNTNRRRMIDKILVLLGVVVGVGVGVVTCHEGETVIFLLCPSRKRAISIHQN